MVPPTCHLLARVLTGILSNTSTSFCFDSIYVSSVHPLTLYAQLFIVQPHDDPWETTLCMIHYVCGHDVHFDKLFLLWLRTLKGFMLIPVIPHSTIAYSCFYFLKRLPRLKVMFPSFFVYFLEVGLLSSSLYITFSQKK